MTAIDLTIYLVGAFGFAYIAGHSTISLPLRATLGGIPAEKSIDENGRERVTRYAIPGALGRAGEWLVSLIECPACLGFWFGLGAAVIGFAESTRPGWLHLGLWSIWWGLLTSGSNFILGRFTRLI